MRSLFLLIVWVVLAATCMFAQTEVKESQKSVDVSVEQNDDGLRTVVININQDGEEKEIKWEDDGVIPEDIRKMLKDEDIDVTMLEDGGDDEREVRVRVRHKGDRDNMRHDVQKRVVIKRDDDGEVDVMEWDGEGEMPEEIQKLLEEHDIDIEELTEEARREKRGMRYDKMKARHKQMRKRAMRDGQQMNKEKEVEYEIITDDGGKVKKKMMWKGGDGKELHLEGDHDIIMLDGPRGRKDRNLFFFEEKDESNAYMGAQIESTDEGVSVLELMKDSPADKAGLNKGDIIQRINGARTKSVGSLLDLLNYFEPGDTVEVSILRGGSEKTMKLTLGEKPGAFR